MKSVRFISVAMASLFLLLMVDIKAAEPPPTKQQSAKLKYNPVPPLSFAAAYGDVDEINRLVKNGAFVDERDWVGQTPLHMAAKFNRVNAVKALLDLGADPRAVNSDYHETPLHNIAKSGTVEIFQMLLAHGANVNAVADIGDYSGGTPLHFATLLSNSYSAVEFLLDNGANINERNLFLETPMHQAVQNQNLQIMKLLKDRGASVSMEDMVGNTPLHSAALNDHPQPMIFKFLIYSGSNVNAQRHDGQTCLHILVRTNPTAFSIMRQLLDAGADPRITDSKNQTVFDIVKLLPKQTPEQKQFVLQMLQITKRSQRQTLTPEVPLLHFFTAHGLVDNLVELFKETANASKLIDETRDWLNQTALHVAVQFQEVDAAKFLIKSGAQVNALDSEQLTPLHIAAKTGNIKMIDLLMTAGADINAWQYILGTPLLTAVKYANAFIPAIRLLVDHGASVTAVNIANEQPIHRAAINQNIKMAEVFLEQGAEINAKSAWGPPLNDLINSYCCYPQIPVLGFFINRGADINLPDEKGHTPLHNAILSRKRKEVVEYLLYRGADPNKSMDSNGCDSPLYLAIKMVALGQVTEGPLNTMPKDGTIDIARLLVTYGADINAVDKCSGKTALGILLQYAPKAEGNTSTTISSSSNSKPDAIQPKLVTFLKSAMSAKMSGSFDDQEQLIQAIDSARSNMEQQYRQQETGVSTISSTKPSTTITTTTKIETTTKQRRYDLVVIDYV